MGRTVVAVAAFVLVAVPLAQAATTTLFYDAPGTWPIGFSCADCAGQNLGGVAFPPQRARPQQVTVADVREAAVGFVACQDFDRDGNCGETNEPIVHGCGGSAVLAASSPIFRPDFWTTVFLSALSDCPGLATQGTVTLTTW